MTDQTIPEEGRRQAARSVAIALARMVPKREFDAAVLVDAVLTAAYPHLRQQIETERAPLESYTITTECRTNRGDGGAWDEAVARLRVVYNAQLARFGPAAVYRIEFHREPASGIPRYVYDAARGAAQPGGQQ